jgi:hypothetical protein
LFINIILFARSGRSEITANHLKFAVLSRPTGPETLPLTTMKNPEHSSCVQLMKESRRFAKADVSILIFVCWVGITYFTAATSALGGTAGCRLDLDGTKFNHAGLTQLTWTANIVQYDFVPSPPNPFEMRLESNSIGFSGETGTCSLSIEIEDSGHSFADDIVGSQLSDPPTITTFPALGLAFSSLQPSWPDDGHGVALLADPLLSPKFGRVFEDVDGAGTLAKNIYTREALATLPVTVKWTVTKGDTVVNPEGSLAKNAAGDFVPLLGTL